MKLINIFEVRFSQLFWFGLIMIYLNFKYFTNQLTIYIQGDKQYYYVQKVPHMQRNVTQRCG